MAEQPSPKSFESGFVPGRHIIDTYGNGGFRFAGMSHRGSILILPSGIRAWPVTAITDLTPADLLSADLSANDHDDPTDEVPDA